MGYIKIIILAISFIIFFKFQFELASIIINDKKSKIKKSKIKNLVSLIIISLTAYFVFTDKREAIQLIMILLAFYIIDIIIFFSKKKNNEEKENKPLKKVLIISGIIVMVVVLVQQYLIYSIGYNHWIVEIGILIVLVVFILTGYYVYKLNKS